jgi:hypothetical protein
MRGLLMLWLPILLSAILVFLVSGVIHMVLPWHKNDYGKLPSEDQVRNALRPLAIPPGDYMVPRPTGRDEMRSPEFAEKLKQGPNMMVTVLPTGPISMRKNFILWFLFTVIVSAFAAYVAGSALPVGASYRAVFHWVGITAFIGYAVALWQDSIWYWRSWSITGKATVDGLIYALLTAGTFGWLWPR